MRRARRKRIMGRSAMGEERCGEKTGARDVEAARMGVVGGGGREVVVGSGGEGGAERAD
jgi:hypothetical protein